MGGGGGVFFFSSRRRHTRLRRDWSSDVCSSDLQKLVVLIMIPVESIPQTYGFLDPSVDLITSYGQGWASAVIVAQLFAGSYLVFLLDELVSKWGIGSGISLFIAAGVAQSTFVGTLSPLSISGGAYSLQNPPAGILPYIFYIFRTASNA